MSVEIIEGADTRIDRLFRLLPLVHQMRDAEQGHVLRALLRVIAEQVNLVEDDIARLYDNWFIETAEDWAVPYIADLVGYRPVADTGHAGAEGALARVLVPRREAANTIRYRRGKGRLALLEQLAHDVAGWPAHAVEYFQLLGWHQNLDHAHPERARLVDVRDVRALGRIGSPFDRSAHSVGIRRINSNRTRGYHNIPSVGVFVWRLRSYPVTYAPANCAEYAGPHCYTFSVLGNDAPLFQRPGPRREDGRGPGELGVPAPIGRRALEQDLAALYGEGKSLAIWAEGWGGHAAGAPLPLDAIIAADLSGWHYLPPRGRIAIDPVLGRIAFPPGQLPKKGVRVSYHYGFSADMGGGEYRRTLYDPLPRAPRDGTEADQPPVAHTLYRVGRHGDYQRLWDALKAWREQQPLDAVIELTDSGVYAEPFLAELAPFQTLQLRAAQGARPVLRLLDWQTDLPDAFSVVLARASRFTLDGVIVTGRGLRIGGVQAEDPDDSTAGKDGCGAALTIRHCTLVPGWGLGAHCDPARPAEPSLELSRVRMRVRIEHSILGSVQVDADQVQSDPIVLCVADSIVDAAAPNKEAIGAPGRGIAHVLLTVLRSTVFGSIEAHALALAEDSIFNDCLHVARRQVGCMRYCYVQPHCRTPRRYACQPDLVLQALKDAPAGGLTAEGERLRVRPQFTSEWYGNPGYAQLGEHCAAEIRRGAHDESEMGAFHHLFQPQREANLRARLEEYTPAGTDVGIIRAS